MPNLAFELQQLASADEHVSAAQARIAAMRARLQDRQAQGCDTTQFAEALGAAEDCLQAFCEHRRLIVEAIEAIRAGRLAST